MRTEGFAQTVGAGFSPRLSVHVAWKAGASAPNKRIFKS
jgi:hypothetical protein